MYNRFTNNAQHVLQYAQQSAQRLEHNYVGTEHILLGLVLNKEGVAGQLLSQLGLTPEMLSALLKSWPLRSPGMTGKRRSCQVRNGPWNWL